MTRARMSGSSTPIADSSVQEHHHAVPRQDMHSSCDLFGVLSCKMTDMHMHTTAYRCIAGLSPVQPLPAALHVHLAHFAALEWLGLGCR